MKSKLKEVRPPFVFNHLKHHWGYVKYWVESDNVEKKSLRTSLKKIGNSQMDMYMGSLTPEQIQKQIRKKLKELNSYSFRKFKAYVDNGYRLLELKDGSLWVLLFNDDEERYIHIHPARYSRHTLRVQANILKSAIGGFVFTRYYEDPLEAVNHARTFILGLSPVKSLKETTG